MNPESRFAVCITAVYVMSQLASHGGKMITSKIRKNKGKMI
jgi:hypothetical protein